MSHCSEAAKLKARINVQQRARRRLSAAPQEASSWAAEWARLPMRHPVPHSPTFTLRHVGVAARRKRTSRTTQGIYKLRKGIYKLHPNCGWRAPLYYMQAGPSV
eukprot:822698-Pleurochrysis_carterae.AAC.3